MLGKYVLSIFLSSFVSLYFAIFIIHHLKKVDYKEKIDRLIDDMDFDAPKKLL